MSMWVGKQVTVTLNISSIYSYITNGYPRYINGHSIMGKQIITLENCPQKIYIRMVLIIYHISRSSMATFKLGSEIC